MLVNSRFRAFEYFKLKRLMKRLIAIMAFAGFVLSGCYYDNAEEVYYYYQFTCDTTAISYAADVEPIINTQCLSCHSGAAPDGNVSLENYAEVQAAAQNGSLHGTITATNGYSIMPTSGPMPECNINKISAWINAGMPNN